MRTLHGPRIQPVAEQTQGGGSGGGVGAVMGTIAVTLGQANGILAGVIAGLAAYRALREAWRAAHPNDPSPFMEDHQLIDLLRQDALAGLREIDAVLAKWTGILTVPDGGPVG